MKYNSITKKSVDEQRNNNNKTKNKGTKVIEPKEVTISKGAMIVEL
jgi:hypothetical protein